MGGPSPDSARFLAGEQASPPRGRRRTPFAGPQAARRAGDGLSSRGMAAPHLKPPPFARFEAGFGDLAVNHVGRFGGCTCIVGGRLN